MDILIDKARTYATAAHGAVGQRRKYTNEPYITHPTAVAELVRAHGGTRDMIAAAYLHDVIEDTQLTFDDLKEAFGESIAWKVDALTNKAGKEDGNRVQRFVINCRALINSLDEETMVIKLCDLLHNTSSIVEHDHGFAAIYLAEKEFMMDEIFGLMKGGLADIVRAKLVWGYEQLSTSFKARHLKHLRTIQTAWSEQDAA